MKKKLGYLLAAVAMLASGAASMGCVFVLADEPKAPKAIID